jgi:hypothetical protein
MANVSPQKAAIDTIVKSLAGAVVAARALDLSASNDLRSLLSIAAGEAERVRKATRRTAPAIKSAPKKAKSGTALKRGASVAVKAAPRLKVRRKPAAVNGAAH